MLDSRGNETQEQYDERNNRNREDCEPMGFWESRKRHLPVILDSDDPDDVPWEPKEEPQE